MTDWLSGVAVAVLLAAAVVFTILFARGIAKGPRGRGEVSDRWLAVAKCRRCEAEYETEWVPGISFSAVRMGLDRYQKCRACGETTWAHFERWAPPSP